MAGRSTWWLCGIVVGTILALLLEPSALAQEPAAEAKGRFPPAWQIRKTRPTRRDEPLRETNISDIEVRQIESLMKTLYPGSIVYISAVTTGCPCQDGANCEDQVWSVATRNQYSKGIALSKIEGEWQVGPLQQWWLIHDRLQRMYTSALQDPDSDFVAVSREHSERLRLHMEAFPYCASGSTPRRTSRPDTGQSP